MKKKKMSIIAILLLLVIGFAAVSTNLIMNINTFIGTISEDFDVYFSSAIIDLEDYSNEVISDDRLSITYNTKVLTFKGDTSILEYEVTNASKNYDAEVKVVCTGEGNEVNIIHTPNTQIIEATSIGTGIVKVELIKTITDPKELQFTCTLDVNAVERTSLGENQITTSDLYVINGTYVDSNNNPITNANLVIYSESPKYVTTDNEGNFLYNGLERGHHEIYYLNETIENIKNLTKEEVVNKAVSTANFYTTSKNEIIFTDNSKITNQSIVLAEKYCNNLLNVTQEFDYTGDFQKFFVPCNGVYQLEVWGAQGGTSTSIAGTTYIGGYGGYSIGSMSIEQNEELYVFVGGQEGVFNGGIGGTSYAGNNNGGDSTHILLSNKSLSENFNTQEEILIVAGGGGGGYGYPTRVTSDYSGAGGNGGGIYGENGKRSGACYWYGTGGSQVSGGSNYYCSGINSSHDGGIKTYNQGVFGAGGYSGGSSGAGGGGGYYGGAFAHYAGGSGGSGYIGNPLLTSKAMYCYNCQESTVTSTKTISVACSESIPQSQCAKQGNGYAKIALISLD